MCGITGFVDRSLRSDSETLGRTVGRMSDTLRHRGPDDSGAWVDAEAGVALGHRRLSIIDLSENGRQPMLSASGRYVIVFNGEVYNFKRLRNDIEKENRNIAWRGHSDTEVMLAAIELWGLENAVKRFNGMFAFALWDRKKRTISLVRDWLGKKPLYYGWCDKTFFFGSELKAIRAHPRFTGEINKQALTLLLRYNYINSPYSIYKGIYKLTPASILTLKYEWLDGDIDFSADPDNPGAGRVKPHRFWSVKEAYAVGAADPYDLSDDEAIEKLDSLLKDSVGLRMLADVPLGAFLSGGVDSSMVVALMQAQSPRPVKTFSIGFFESEFDEAVYAKEVASHLGTDHTELYITPETAMTVIPKLPELFDEPFADSSQIPTYLVSELARRDVTVSLSGDGGDELFAGYHRYLWGARFMERTNWIPGAFKGLASFLMKSVPHTSWNAIFRIMEPFMSKELKQPNAGDKMHKLATVLAASSPEEIYLQLVSQWDTPERVALGAREPVTPVTNKSSWLDVQDFAHRLMYIDLATYFTDDILAKVDRASMAVSLETRAPIIDYRVVELAARMPGAMKIRNGESKWLLRQVLYKYVPKKLIERPKRGFSIPLGEWLRGPLRDWAESLLDERRLMEDGIFDHKLVRQKWKEHLSGVNWRNHIWPILVFQAWADHNGSKT
ncbi:Asparagine synthetase [glutamine-hydrolyzing] [hydrothermal vent metagenome]|uniref:Asparagine synthetase [glutamine-hydrolyzing] n=1 Tax=hydrothermal vent metagenome TaxID=652676 RepID=A0A3B1BZK4_9ZZZZ